MKIITVSLLSVFLIASCSSSNTPATPVQEIDTVAVSSPTPPVAVDGVSGATNVELATMLNGTLTIPAENNITITLPMGGVIATFTHLPGEYVQKGEVVAVLENREFVDLQQNYLESDAQVVFLEEEYARQQALSAEDATSKKRLQQSRSEFLTIKSRKEAAAAHLRMLGVDPLQIATKGIATKLDIRAPQGGYISDVMVNKGKYVAPGEAICQIINKSQLLISLVAYEKDLQHIRSGQSFEFRVNGLGNKSFAAVISTIDQRVDPVNRSVKVYAKITSANQDFRPGMYVTAQFK